MERALGASEHLLWHLARARPVNVVLCASLTGAALSVQRLRGALDFAQRRHALLAVRIRADGEGRPWFTSEGVPRIPLRVVSRRNAEHWEREVEDELTRPFDPGQGPLLRATLLQGPEAHELLLTFDHTLGDGMSGAFLVRDLLREAAQPGTGQQLPDPAACEDLLPVGISLPEVPRAAPSEPSGPPRADLRALQAGATDSAPADGRAVRLLTWHLPEEDSARLVAASRREGTSVHGALCAAFLLPLAAELGTREEVLLTVMSPVNLRERLQPSGGEAFAAYFTRQRTHHQLQSTSRFWEVARDVKHQLHQDTAGPGVFANLLALKALLATNPDTPSLLSFAKGLMGSELTVTNLGRLGFEEQYGLLRLERLYLTVSGLAPLIVGVTTVGGRLCVTSRYLESVIPAARAQRLQQGAREHLQSALVPRTDM